MEVVRRELVDAIREADPTKRFLTLGASVPIDPHPVRPGPRPKPSTRFEYTDPAARRAWSAKNFDRPGPLKQRCTSTAKSSAASITRSVLRGGMSQYARTERVVCHRRIADATIPHASSAVSEFGRFGSLAVSEFGRLRRSAVSESRRLAVAVSPFASLRRSPVSPFGSFGSPPFRRHV